MRRIKSDRLLAKSLLPPGTSRVTLTSASKIVL
jgi:hypothetical protein